MVSYDDYLLENAIDELVACQIPIELTPDGAPADEILTNLETFLPELIKTRDEADEGRLAAEIVLRRHDGMTRLVDALMIEY